MQNIQAPAYTITNEDLRSQIAHLNDRPQQDILTVAASGDQAMFYHLAGATHIDTFDITENARLIQEIKFAAIHVLNRAEYIEMLNALHKPRDIFGAKHFSTVLPHLAAETIQYIKTNNDKHMFNNGLSANSYPEYLPTDAEYAKLRETLTDTPNFIHTPLDELNTKISGQYDIINISNIFDFCDARSQGEILMNLGQNLKIGGRILYPAQYPRYKYDGVCCPNRKTGTVVEFEKKLPGSLFVFQRTR